MALTNQLSRASQEVDSSAIGDQRRTREKAHVASLWPKIRLGLLLAILMPLSVFGYFRMRYTNARAAIQKSLVDHDNLKAISLIKEMEKADGMTAETCFWKARAYRHLGDDVGFLQNLELASQLGFSERKTTIEKMLRDAQTGELGPDMAIKMEELLTDNDVEFEEAACSLVYGYLDANQLSSVFPILTIWSSQDKNTPWVPYFYGMIAQNHFDWAKSLEAFGQAAKANPDFVPLYRSLGVSYQKINEHEKAIEAFEKYLNSNPKDTEVISMLASSFISMDQLDKGLELLVPFIESNTATDEMRITVAKLYLDNKNEPQKAIDMVGTLSNLWPEDVAIASIMSRSNQRLGKDDEASRYEEIAKKGQVELLTVDERVSALQRGINDTAERNYELGHVLLHKRSREEGILWLKQAIARDPRHIKAFEDIVIYFKRTNKTEMATRYEQFLSKLKGTP